MSSGMPQFLPIAEQRNGTPLSSGLNGRDVDAAQAEPRKSHAIVDETRVPAEGSSTPPHTINGVQFDDQNDYLDAEACLKELQAISVADLRSNGQVRDHVRAVSSKLTRSLEAPFDVCINTSIAPMKAAMVRTALDLDLFSLLAKANGPMSTKEVALHSGAEEALVKRILRLLSEMSFVREADQDSWQATPITRSMATDYVAAGYRFHLDILIASSMQAPAYFREKGFRCPTEPNPTIHQFAHKTEHNVFDFMRVCQPDRMHDFNIWMGNTLGSQKSWVEAYPVRERLLDGFDESHALVVDIAGGKGHDMQAFRDKFADVGGRLVVQDMAETFDSIAEGSLHPSIQCQAHDMFQENPVRGARAYFLHHVLHDWSDAACLKILAQVRAAMTPGYSKILIQEFILADKDVPEKKASWDLLMMVLNSGMERTRSQWIDLLQRAGFGHVEFWYTDDSQNADSIIEATIDP